MDMHLLEKSFEPSELEQLGTRAEEKMNREHPHMVDDETRYSEFYEYFAHELQQYVSYQDYDAIITNYMENTWEDLHSNHGGTEE